MGLYIVEYVLNLRGKVFFWSAGPWKGNEDLICWRYFTNQFKLGAVSELWIRYERRSELVCLPPLNNGFNSFFSLIYMQNPKKEEKNPSLKSESNN